MEKIAVVTDTGSNLSFAQAKELGIYLLPLQITIDETTYQDTLEISTQDIYNELANGKMPKTSMAAYQKIYDLFEKLKKEVRLTSFAIKLLFISQINYLLRSAVIKNLIRKRITSDINPVSLSKSFFLQLCPTNILLYNNLVSSEHF